MTTESLPKETMVSDRGRITIPAALRQKFDIKPSDKLRWNVTESEEFTVSVVKQRFGAFGDDDQQVPLGGDSIETHDLAGHEEDATFSKSR